ncbi:hypothetical protein [Peribacillus frigoritolerans]|uniref:hypothetical protein n=1 Tax=Peribacillus frigoritolerans TaxID=450367 RepID=UPI0038031750
MKKWQHLGKKEQLENQGTFNKEFVIPGIQQIKGEISSIRGSIERDKELDESNRAAKEAKQLIAAATENPDTTPDKQKRASLLDFSESEQRNSGNPPIAISQRC